MAAGVCCSKWAMRNRPLLTFTTAIVSKPDFALAYARRGEAKMILRSKESAFKDFDAAIAADPKLVEAYIVRASYRFQTGDKPGAKA